MNKNTGEKLRDAIEEKPHTMRKVECGKCGLMTLARDINPIIGICQNCEEMEVEEIKSDREMFIMAH